MSGTQLDTQNDRQGYAIAIEFQYRIGPLLEPLYTGSHRQVAYRLHPGTRYMAHIGMAMHPLALLRYLELDPNGQAAQVA